MRTWTSSRPGRSRLSGLVSRATSPLAGRVAFLVGVRRSGTNWLHRIVEAHPDASVIPGETYLFSHGIAALTERVQHGLAGSARTGTVFVDRDVYFDAVRDLCDRILEGHLATLDHPGRLIVERTPDHVRVLELINEVYPDAAVVHIIRDGRDVARSLVSQPWGPSSFTEAAAEWVSGIEAARRAAPLLPRYLEISYDGLVADPGSQVPALYRFLGLSDEPKIVARALVEAAIPYNVGPRSPERTSAKRRVGLAREELTAVLEVAGPLLVELGYDIERAELSGAAAPGRVAASPGSDAPGRLGAGRALLGSAGRRIGRVVRRGGGASGSVAQRAPVGGFDGAMAMLDDLLGDVAARRFDDLARRFSPNARIRVVDGAESWDARGSEALARLATIWSADPALAGRQVRGDVHPGAPSFVVVATWEAHGISYDRVLVVTRFVDCIDELVWYVLPRAVGAPSGSRAATDATVTP